MYLFSFHICTHLFVCTWNIWICLPVFIKSNRSKPWKKQSSSTHLPSFRGHISFMSVTPAATGTFVLWIVHICITHVYAFRDWKVPAWRKHAEPKLREKREPGIQPDPRGQLSSASDFWYRGVFNVEHWKSDYFSPGKVGNSDHIIHVKSNSFWKFISLHISFRNGIVFFLSS